MREDIGFGLTLEQYNNGIITARLRDQISTDSDQTDFLFDYMRVC
jgi:hypothetical protein